MLPRNFITAVISFASFSFATSAPSAPPFVSTCDSTFSRQLWNFSSNKLQSLSSSSCLATVDCNPIAGGDVTMIDCDIKQCNNILWNFDTQGRLVSVANPNLCLTLANVDGPDINLWQCNGAVENGLWNYSPSSTFLGYGLFNTRDTNAGLGCLTNPNGGSSLIVLNTSQLGLPVYGIGGLAAIGGARLIYEYIEPQRSQILDLLFNTTGGTAFQVLKTEIEGDMDSSYGSGPSFRHSRGETPSFNRGIYLPWLLGEAKKRQPSIGTYSLAWGLPGWVGNSSYLSEESLQYHIDYLVGVRETYGYIFDITGIHNERPFSRQWTIALRAALDANNFNSTKISVNDDGNSGCQDCGSFPDTSITTAALNDPEFRKALGVIGLHTSSPLPKTYNWESDGKIFIQSEANDVDGPLIETADGSFPQWAPNAASPLGPGLEWPLHFLQNYAQGRNTGMIICPLSHAWTWAYGRHNHGTALFIRPWDGHFVLGAAFWTQAHITQATASGWFFLDGSATGSSEQTTYSAFTSPTFDQFSIVAVNTDPNATTTLNFELTGSLLSLFSGTSIAVWVSNSSILFTQVDDIFISTNGNFSYSLGPRSVLTITSLRTLRHANIPVPTRKPYPIPYLNSFTKQRIEEPGYLLSDLFGAFYTVNDPLNQKGKCLKQAVPAYPNPWLGQDGLPFTSLPAPGTTFANGNLSASVLLTTSDLPPKGSSAASVSLCGRVPIWQPADYASQDAHLGVCLWLFANGTWSLIDAEIEKSADLVLASGVLTSGSVLDSWHTLSLAFVDDKVSARVDGVIVAADTSGMRRSSGSYGLGTGWHIAYFDDIFFNTSMSTPFIGDSSFLFDILPGEAIVNNVTGWAGFELDLTNPSSQTFSINALGRFKVRGNSATHSLDIIDASSLKSILTGGPTTIDFSNCQTDANGFCYGSISPVSCVLGKKYFFISSEVAGGDSFLSMYDAAAATTHAHRDGTTMMSYKGPGFGVVTGKVFGVSYDTLTSDGNIETMNGPLNFLIE